MTPRERLARSLTKSAVPLAVAEPFEPLSLAELYRRHAQTVARTWDTATTYDPQKSIEIAVGLYRANYSLRRIGEELALRGLTPQRGGAWHAAQVRHLLLLAKIGA